ncbi:hypothetical protein NIES3275_21730 [Microchaete diplosiphon NIES-3275]|nr:hypothetical protein NIES3275_21730 [Microchaete diplosiphon NIES-3275]
MRINKQSQNLLVKLLLLVEAQDYTFGKIQNDDLNTNSLKLNNRSKLTNAFAMAS